MPRLCKTVREQVTAAMRAEIRSAFCRLIAEQKENGDVTMDQIAAALGIAKGTLYLYYSTKEELVRDALDVERNAVIEKMQQQIRPEFPAPDQLILFARIMMEEFHRNRWLRLEFIRNHPLTKPPIHNRNQEILSGILAQGIREKTFRKVPVEETALFIRNALIGQFRYMLRAGIEINVEQSLALFSDLILRALRRDA